MNTQPQVSLLSIENSLSIKANSDTLSTTAGNFVELVAMVKDFQSNLVSGVAVNWEVASGNGTLSDCSSSTDTSGLSKCKFTTDTSAGENTIIARIVGTKIKVTFFAVGVPIVEPLTINAPSITIPVLSGYTYTFVPAGGVAPFSFSVPSGSGAVDSGGVYTAGTTGTTAVVRVTDSIGNSVDSNVSLANSLTNGLVFAKAKDLSGNLYLGGNFTAIYPYTAPSMLAVNTSNGDTELAFDLKSGFNGIVRAIARDTVTGAVYVGGEFTQYQGFPAKYLVKLNAKGQLDNTFQKSGNSLSSSVYALALSSDGSSIFVGGAFYDHIAYKMINLTPTTTTTRVNFIGKISTRDGSLDPKFQVQAGLNGFNADVYTLALDSSGFIYVGGPFATYRGATVNGIAKLNAENGNLDKGFTIAEAIGFNGVVNALALDPSGFVYVGGSFTAYRSTAGLSCIAKLKTSNGDLVDTFTSGKVGFMGTLVSTGSASIRHVTALSFDTAGFLYVGGYFGQYRGSEANHIVKLVAEDGSIASRFSSSGGFNNIVNTLVLD